MTTDEDRSPQRKKPCVFPWIDDRDKKKNEGCANPDGDNGGFWCPTEVNDDMKYVGGKGNWGYCNDICLTTEQKESQKKICQNVLGIQVCE